MSMSSKACGCTEPASELAFLLVGRWLGGALNRDKSKTDIQSDRSSTALLNMSMALKPALRKLLSFVKQMQSLSPSVFAVLGFPR